MQEVRLPVEDARIPRSSQRKGALVEAIIAVLRGAAVALMCLSAILTFVTIGAAVLGTDTKFVARAVVVAGAAGAVSYIVIRYVGL